MKKFVLLGFSIILSTVLCTGCSLSKASANPTFPLPGEPLGNVKLQADTYNPAIIAAGLEVSNCKNFKDFKVTNVKVIKRPYDIKVENGIQQDGKWQEEWEINACGTTVYVPVYYQLNPQGAIYRIPQNEVHK